MGTTFARSYKLRKKNKIISRNMDDWNNLYLAGWCINVTYSEMRHSFLWEKYLHTSDLLVHSFLKLQTLCWPVKQQFPSKHDNTGHMLKKKKTKWNTKKWWFNTTWIANKRAKLETIDSSIHQYRQMTYNYQFSIHWDASLSKENHEYMHSKTKLLSV